MLQWAGVAAAAAVAAQLVVEGLLAAEQLVVEDLLVAAQLVFEVAAQLVVEVAAQLVVEDLLVAAQLVVEDLLVVAVLLVALAEVEERRRDLLLPRAEVRNLLQRAEEEQGILQ